MSHFSISVSSEPFLTCIPTTGLPSPVGDIDGDHQVGVANTHAYLWTGTAASGVDLTPPNATSSAVNGVYGDQQVGDARINGYHHAGIWRGTGASWIDLSQFLPGPQTNQDSQALDIWGDENLTHKFFTYSCPRLYDLQTVAYWILEKDAHTASFKANLRHITQVAIELDKSKAQFYYAKGYFYIVKINIKIL
jgi:hypothetical protein